VTLVGSVLVLILCFVTIFFGARSCVAAQEATQIRKYITSADSTLSDSANVGNEELQPTISSALENSDNLDTTELNRSADAAQKGYQEAMRNQEVPPDFENVHHYMVTALGIRAAATGELAKAAEGSNDEFEEALPAAVEDYKLSDAIIVNHYLPASEDALSASGRRGDQNYLYEPRPFMDYEALGLSNSASSGESPPDDPSAPRDVKIFSVAVAGRPLVQDGNVVLTGSDELTFAVTVLNSAEVAETGVPLEVVLNTRAERQALPATVERMEPGDQATVEVKGFKPGELDETAEVSVKVGPVKYEQNEADNVLTGTVTFGI
jgi:hypothetical protein